MNTICYSEQEKIIKYLEENNLISHEIKQLLKSFNLERSYINKERTRFNLKSLKILFSIFTNPYGIEVKRKKQHIYEITGSIINRIRLKLY